MTRDIRDGGRLALGIAIGALATLTFFFYSHSCGTGRTSLWMCDETPEVVVATLGSVTRIIEAFAWPITVVVAGLMFRNGINNLLPKLRLLKGPGVEAKFDDLVEKAAESLASENQIDEPRPELPDKIQRYFENSRQLAVLAAWIDIEAKLAELLKRKPGSLDAKARRTYFSESTLRSLELPNNIVASILDLRGARNTLAHTNDASLDDASILRYLEIAVEIDRYLDKRLEQA